MSEVWSPSSREFIAQLPKAKALGFRYVQCKDSWALIDVLIGRCDYVAVRKLGKAPKTTRAVTNWTISSWIEQDIAAKEAKQGKLF